MRGLERIDTETRRTLLQERQSVLRLVIDLEAGSIDVQVIRYLLAAEDLTMDFEGLMIAGQANDRKDPPPPLANTQSALAIQDELAGGRPRTNDAENTEPNEGGLGFYRD